MNPSFTPHMEILPTAQQMLWPELHAASKLGFVLYGGTAIALQLGHRHSVDFDFFTDRDLEKEALRAIPFLQSATTLQEGANTLTMLIPKSEKRPENVKISFFGGITFGRVGEPRYTSDQILQVASLDDLMATKVKVILQRVETKDYVDIAALVNAGVELNKGLAAAREMFGRDFQPSESLKAMVYFEGGDLHMLSHEIKQTLIEAARAVGPLPQISLINRRLTLR